MSRTESSGRPPKSPGLRGLVDRFWYVSDPDRRGAEIKLPTPTAQIVVNLDAARLSTRSHRSRSAETETAGAVGLSAIAPGAVVLDRCEQRRRAGGVLPPDASPAVARDPAHPPRSPAGRDRR